jgi:hypothetical protein
VAQRWVTIFCGDAGPIPAAVAFRDRADPAIITETLLRFTCGDRTGYGIAKYLRQVR